VTIKLNDQQRKALKPRIVDLLMHTPWIIEDYGKQPHDFMRRYVVRKNPKMEAVGPASYVPSDEPDLHIFTQDEALRAKTFYSAKLAEALIETIEAT